MAWEEDMGYVGNIIYQLAFVHDEIVFALFLAVRFLCSEVLPF